MNYYRRYVGDYLRDTSRLSMLEHGAYNLLLDYYYAEERPIPLDMDEVWRMVRAIAPEERRAVQKVLTTFFSRHDDGWHQKRVDHEIEVSKTARSNGGKGGRRATGTGTGIETGLITGSETGGVTNEVTGTGHPPTTNHQPPPASLQPPQPRSRAAKAAPAGFDEFWAAYPKRTGNNPRGAAERAFAARLRDGVTASAMTVAAANYARFCEATGKAGSEYVMRASTFLGPDRPYAQQWAAPKANGNWMASPESMLAKAKELGISTMGETTEGLRRRIQEKLQGVAA